MHLLARTVYVYTLAPASRQYQFIQALSLTFMNTITFTYTFTFIFTYTLVLAMLPVHSNTQTSDFTVYIGTVLKGSLVYLEG